MKKLITYPYLLSLAISFLMVGSAWKLGYIDFNKTATPLSVEITEDPEETLEDISQPAENSVPAADEIPAVLPEEPEIPTFFEADRSYFDDALFIGDSRTVGLRKYGDLGNAIVLADTGMSVYKVFKNTFRLPSGEQIKLNDLLTQNQFGKIYIMLGINELGYNFDQTVKVYNDMVTSIEAMQPEALIFLQANLHITEKKSNSSDIYNNDNINLLNLEIQKMTDRKKYFYLDANELFDDETGNLSTEYTADESHVLGKYYAGWVDWILQHAVTTSENIEKGTSH